MVFTQRGEERRHPPAPLRRAPPSLPAFPLPAPSTNSVRAALSTEPAFTPVDSDGPRMPARGASPKARSTGQARGARAAAPAPWPPPAERGARLAALSACAGGEHAARGRLRKSVRGARASARHWRALTAGLGSGACGGDGVCLWQDSARQQLPLGARAGCAHPGRVRTPGEPSPRTLFFAMPARPQRVMMPPSRGHWRATGAARRSRARCSPEPSVLLARAEPTPAAAPRTDLPAPGRRRPLPQFRAAAHPCATCSEPGYVCPRTPEC